MRGRSWFIAIALSAAFGMAVGCFTGEERRKSALFLAQSSKSAAENAAPEKKPGFEAMFNLAETLSRDLGIPQAAMDPIDFSRDTRLQKAVEEANAQAASYKKKVEDREKTIAALKRWGMGGLVALLSLFGIKGGVLLKLLSSLKKAKTQVTSLVEGSQGVITKVADVEVAVKAIIAKVKAGEKIGIEDLEPLASLGGDTVKTILQQTQAAYGTWESLKPIIDETKKVWKAGEAA